MRRQEMMNACPEEFKEEFEEILNSIESRVVEIHEGLEIKGVEDLHQIENAKTLCGDLATDLY